MFYALLSDDSAADRPLSQQPLLSIFPLISSPRSFLPGKPTITAPPQLPQQQDSDIQS